MGLDKILQTFTIMQCSATSPHTIASEMTTELSQHLSAQAEYDELYKCKTYCRACVLD